MDPDDRELLRRIQGGDGESFGILYDRTHRWLRTLVIVPRVGREEADEVLSDTFHVALASIGEFRWEGIAILHWLAAIAKRKSLEHLRRKRPERCCSLDEAQALLDWPDDVPAAEADMIRKEALATLRGRVTSTLGRLPPRYAEALRLRLLEERGRLECAERFSLSAATFDVLFHRATRAFAREWKKT